MNRHREIIDGLNRAEVGLWIAIGFGIVGLVCKVLALVLR